jgi:tetratricopeptide (TPR) repeat protein
MIAERIKLLVNVRIGNRARLSVLRAAAMMLLALGFGALSVSAQVDTSHPPLPPPSPPSQDATPPAADPSKGAAPGGADVPASAPAEAPATPAFDPLHAEKSMEVGEYYLKAGDYAAAVDRFKEAIGYQSNLALAWDYLGQACEKEHESEDALADYQKFLSMVPDGKESDRVRKRVAKLQSDIAHDTGKKSGN